MDDVKHINSIIENIIDTNKKINIILGSSNINTDFKRHKNRYQVAIGGENDINNKDMLCISKYYETDTIQNFISIIKSYINMIVIDYSVCITLDIKDFLLFEKGTIFYVPLRNIYLRIDDFMLNEIKQLKKEDETTLKMYNYIYEQKYLYMDDLNIHSKKQPIYKKILSSFYKILEENNILYIVYDNNNDFSYPVEKYENNNNGLSDMSYIELHYTK